MDSSCFTNESDYQASRQRIRDLEAHCRQIHGDAVIHAFMLLITLPMRLARTLGFRQTAINQPAAAEVTSD